MSNVHQPWKTSLRFEVPIKNKIYINKFRNNLIIALENANYFKNVGGDLQQKKLECLKHLEKLGKRKLNAFCQYVPYLIDA